MNLTKILAGFLITPVLLGIVTGILYANGYINDHGLWVDILGWTTSFTLEKWGFAYGVFSGIYILGWAYLSKLSAPYAFAKILILKCFLWITVVPVFCITASFWIPPLKPLLPIAIYVAVMGYVLTFSAIYFFQTIPKNPND